ncbi:MAG: hypothetical protein BWX50_00582 [Euryarchaeota archaeon ADurb.Bin009]|nr:MAG: hypothetical protein BWX50_00582 [Euryarchaeota archaeon ADurb.Bin009]
MIRKEKMAGCLPAWHLPGAGRIAPRAIPPHQTSGNAMFV